MKKIICAIFAVLTALSLAACADPSSKEPGQPVPHTPAASVSVNTEAETQPDATAQSTEAVTTPGAAVNQGYSVELVQSEYAVSDTNITVRFNSTNGESYIIRGDKWRLYKEENGQRVLVGYKTTEECIEHKAPMETTISLGLLGMSEWTEGVYYLQHIDDYSTPLCDLRLTVK